jgi:hypothetical protein
MIIVKPTPDQLDQVMISVWKNESTSNLQQESGIGTKLLSIWDKLLQQHAVNGADKQTSGVWEMMKWEFHQDFLRVFDTRNTVSIENFLYHAKQNKVTHGIGYGEEVFRVFCNEETRKDFIEDLWIQLIVLGMSVGAIPYWSFEQVNKFNPYEIPLIELKEMVEAVIGFKISANDDMGNFGLRIGDSLIDGKICQDIFTAWGISRLISRRGSRKAKVAEIGAGMGGAAEILCKYFDVRVDIYDLPVINILQIANLSSSVSSKILDDPTGNNLVNILPYFEFAKQKYELVLNRDSFPEMQKEQLNRYITRSAYVTTRLLSINQESQNLDGTTHGRQHWAHEEFMKSGLWESKLRLPYPFRDGYVYELMTAKR